MLLAAETRFAGRHIITARLRQLQSPLRAVVNDEKFAAFRTKQSVAKRQGIVDPIKAKIVGDDMWDRFTAAIMLLTPCLVLLRMFDSDTPSIGEVIPGFVTMLQGIKTAAASPQCSSEDAQSAAAMLLVKALKRWHYMKHSVYAAAYALNPRSV